MGSSSLRSAANKISENVIKKITTSSCVDAVSALWPKHCTATEENADFV